MSETTASLTSKMVKPGLFSSVVLNTIQMFFPVMHVVLKGPVTVITVVSLPHNAAYVFKPVQRHPLNLWKRIHTLKL